MPFNDQDCFLEPKKVAMHVFDSVGGDWHEWTGTLTTGDIEIGAVEIKNATTDTRAEVVAGGFLRVKDSKTMVQSQATGAAAIAMSLNPGANFYLDSFEIHLNAVGASGTLAIVKDALAGAAYDVSYVSLAMAAVTDYVFQPPRPIYCVSGDLILVTWANAGGKTYGATINYFLA